MKKRTATRLLLGVFALSFAAVVPLRSYASGGSGGGGRTTTGGGGGGSAPAGGGGGGSTAPAGGGGGGGSVKTCSPSIAVTASASQVAGERLVTATYTVNCASRSSVMLTATNLATGIVEWVPATDSLTSTYTWNAPLFGATYRVDAVLVSNAGSQLGAATAQVTTMLAPADCGPFLDVAASAGTTAANYSITASYSLVWCGGPSNVILSATNVATGTVEWQQSTAAATDAVFLLPQFSTDYRIDAVAYDGVAVLARSSTNVSTIATPPNCATITNENLSTGYWGLYAAIWISTTAKDCGYGRTSLRIKITNLSSGVVEYDNPTFSLVVPLLDYEGPAVSYDSDYQVDVEVHGAAGELLDSSSRSLRTPPSK